MELPHSYRRSLFVTATLVCKKVTLLKPDSSGFYSIPMLTKQNPHGSRDATSGLFCRSSFSFLCVFLIFSSELYSIIFYSLHCVDRFHFMFSSSGHALALLCIYVVLLLTVRYYLSILSCFYSFIFNFH